MSGEFFAIDRKEWARACGVGLNEAVAYLVLARFSGPNNATTSASTNAVETYTGIARSRAKKAIASLVTTGLLKQTKTGSRPAYRFEHKLGEDSIFLPNAIVTGAASETPPVEVLRQSQDALLLRLFVELYFVQNLVEDGGISRKVVYQKYERHNVGQRGEHDVFGFERSGTYVFHGTPSAAPHTSKDATGKIDVGPFFKRIDTLASHRLIEWVPIIHESDEPTGEAVFPCGTGRSDSLEDRIGRAAYAAGASMLSAPQLEWAREKNLILVPVRRHRSKTALIGIARLHYRPKTSVTSAWYANAQESGERWLQVFESIRASEATRATG
ncbi:hypothetical protein [Labilithrix luteola]|nr:hypothetical protein [Labilithrix luteola]